MGNQTTLQTQPKPCITHAQRYVFRSIRKEYLKGTAKTSLFWNPKIDNTESMGLLSCVKSNTWNQVRKTFAVCACITCYVSCFPLNLFIDFNRKHLYWLYNKQTQIPKSQEQILFLGRVMYSQETVQNFCQVLEKSTLLKMKNSTF